MTDRRPLRRRPLLAAASTFLLGGCEAISPATTRERDGPPRECPPSPSGGSDCDALAPRDAPAHLSVSAQSLSAPTDSLVATLENGGTTPLLVEADAAQFYAVRDGSWRYLDPKGVPDGRRMTQVEPGDTVEWMVGVDNSDLRSLTVPGTDPASRLVKRDFVFRLPPGRYAIGVRCRPEGSEWARLPTVAFSVEGNPLDLRASRAVERVQRDGNTLVVRTRTGRESDRDRRVTLRAERVGGNPGSGTELTTLELYNPHYVLHDGAGGRVVDALPTTLLRDALAHVRGNTEDIEVQTVDARLPPLGLGDDESVRVAQGGRVWELTSERGW